jgi:glycine cleavage system H protein
MTFPEDLYYTKDHEWLRLDGDGTATIGITGFAQEQLGDIVYVDLHAAGSAVAAEGVFGTVEAVKTVSDLYMPVAGTILETNAALNGQPELVNQDPYGAGWMVKIRLEDPAAVEALLRHTAYAALVG